MQSAAPVAYETQLRPFLRERALRLPEGYNLRTPALARQWRLEAGDDDAAIVERALACIRSAFIYTLSTPLPSRHPVDVYLFDQQASLSEPFSPPYESLMPQAATPTRRAARHTGR